MDGPDLVLERGWTHTKGLSIHNKHCWCFLYLPLSMTLITRSILCVSLLTLLLMSHWLPISADVGHKGILKAQRSGVLSLQHETVMKRYSLADLGYNNRKLGVYTRKRGIGTRVAGKKSSAIQTKISLFHATSILCTSLLLGFFLIS